MINSPAKPPVSWLVSAVAFAIVAATALSPAERLDDPAFGELTGFKALNPADLEDSPTVTPPQGAIILFDGADLDKWTKVDGTGDPGWLILPTGEAEVRGGSIRTREAFDGHFRLHVEFRVPYMPEAKGQARGNSGVYLQGRYEVQVLDSYGLKSKDNDCGGIYEVAAPLANACKAPTVWQAYDIDFKAPVFKNGQKQSPARISVVQNGATIHKDVEITVDNTRAGLGGDPSKPGPIMLQDHGNPVRYRNIWLVPID